MSKERVEITCPHCRRSYALRVDPAKLKNTMSMARCGRCGKRFSLAMRVTAVLEEGGGEVEQPRPSFRKRITQPAIRARRSIEPHARASAPPPEPRDVNVGPSREAQIGKVDVAFDAAWQRASAAMQAMAEARIDEPRHGVLPELPAGADGFDDAWSTPPRRAEATPSDEPPMRQAEDVDIDTPRAPATPPAPTTEPVSDPPSFISTSRPPDQSTVPPMSRQVAGALSRQAWLQAADQDLSLLVPARTPSVRALEWLLAEDELREG